MGKPRRFWDAATETQEPKVLPGSSKTSHPHCPQWISDGPHVLPDPNPLSTLHLHQSR